MNLQKYSIETIVSFVNGSSFRNTSKEAVNEFVDSVYGKEYEEKDKGKVKKQVLTHLEKKYPKCILAANFAHGAPIIEQDQARFNKFVDLFRMSYEIKPIHPVQVETV